MWKEFDFDERRKRRVTEMVGNGGVVSPWSVSFSSLFSLFGIRVSRKNKKGGGKDPPDPLPWPLLVEMAL
jgi:hypothetical protein